MVSKIFIVHYFNRQVYFPTADYPINKGFKGEGYNKLKQEIERQSVFSGFQVYSNGGGGNKRPYKCIHGLNYRNDIDEKKWQMKVVKSFKVKIEYYPEIE